MKMPVSPPLNLDAARKDLPIYKIKSRLISEIRQHPALVLLGETGCGKTTQIPQYIYENHPHIKGMIGCTQPRRVAAITVAKRVAEEMSEELGKTVGYCVRFEDVTSPETKIKYMTDGMLLREAISDPLLSRYSMVILDEVHERTIHTDILLGITKAAQQSRASNKSDHHLKPLKVILMSATMDVDVFSDYFNKAPVLYLEGRQFQVDVFHSASEQTDYLFSAISTVFQIHKTAPSNEDILVFMTGQEEIESTVKTISELNKANAKSLPMLVLPLYSSMPSQKQLKVFEKAPNGHRKIIISTNIAETSITIKGIKYVIDTGMIKSKMYTPSNNLEILKVHKISKSQAWQRTGRAGRESNGICYRLFTEAEFESMPLSTVPEILRSNLSSVGLQLIALGMKDLANFDFMNKPSAESLDAALNELEAIGAIKKSVTNSLYDLTAIGKRMAQFPLDPKLSRCILAAEKLNCVEDLLKIVSILSVDSIFHSSSGSSMSNSSKRDLAEAIKQKFVSADGDHITLLNVYKAFVANKSNRRTKIKAMSGMKMSAVSEYAFIFALWQVVQNCVSKKGEKTPLVYLSRFYDFKNLKLAVEICKQLRGICQRNNIHIMSSLTDTVNIRCALIQGFFMNAAEYQKENEYKTITTRQIVYIHPSSVLFNSKPTCVLYNELVKTNKTYLRDVSVLSANWLLETNPSYFKSKLKTADDNSTNFNKNIIK